MSLANEELLSLREAAKHLPARDGKFVHVSTIWRWATRGLKGVRLETTKLGGRRMTSHEALERFFHALNDDSDDTSHRPAPRQRQRQIAQTHARASEILRAKSKRRQEVPMNK